MFWEKYEQLCRSVGKSPTPLSVELGFSNATASGWKKGAQPRGAALKKIADYFGVSVEYLVSGEEKTPAAQGDGLEAQFYDSIKALCPADQEKLARLMDALANEPEKTKAKFALFLETL